MKNIDKKIGNYIDIEPERARIFRENEELKKLLGDHLDDVRPTFSSIDFHIPNDLDWYALYKNKHTITLGVLNPASLENIPVKNPEKLNSVLKWLLEDEQKTIK